MADVVDEGNEINAFHLELALQRHKGRVNTQRAAENLAMLTRGEEVECEECGEAIEPKRIELIPDTEYCSSCANIIEKKRSVFAKR